MKLQNKVAIVTGASSGIGFAVAQLFAQRGARVVLAARSKEKITSLAKTMPGAIAIPTDMTDEKQIMRLVQKTREHLGSVDILINNAGRGYDAPVEDTNIKRFHELFDLNVVGPLVAMQQVIPIMKKQKSGTIVNISSGTALMALPNMSAYSSLKRALVGISLTARAELKRYGIIVSVVYPYMTTTDFEKNTLKDGEELPWEDEGGRSYEPPKPDSAAYVAEKIAEGIQSEAAEIFVHDWMNPRAH